MTKCPHCNKLIHSENLYVEYDIKDQDKISELFELADWFSAWQYLPKDPREFGKLKCGDIWIHFMVKIYDKQN